MLTLSGNSRITLSGDSWLGALLILMFLCAGTDSNALSPDRPAREFMDTAWTAKDGAPGATLGLAGMVQDRDGYLWLASSTGLTRFDGLRFERYPLPRDPRMQSFSATTVFAPQSGGLWIGFTFGGVGRLEAGKFEYFSDLGGLPVSSSESFAEAPDGSLWVATGTGLARLVGNVWQRAPTHYYPPPRGAVSILIDSEGTLWLMSTEALYSMAQGSQDLIEFREMNGVSGVCESTDGVIWLEDATTLRPLHQLSRAPSHARCIGTGLLIDHANTLWSIDPQGLHRLAHSNRVTVGKIIPKRSTDTLTDLAASPAVELLEDSESNLWAFQQQGLHRLSEPKLVHELGTTRNPATSRDLVRPFLVAAGDRILTSQERGAGLLVLSEGSATQGPDLPGITTAACSGRDDAVTIATTAGLFRVNSDKSEQIPMPDSASHTLIQAMAQDGPGNLWISVIQDRVYRRKGDQWTAYGGIETLPRESATVISEGADGRVWLGYRDGRVAVAKDHSAILYSAEPQIGGALAIYAGRNRVWIGGTFGVAVVEGTRLRHISTETSSDLYGIAGIVETARGDLWITGSAGLVLISATELLRSSRDPQYKVNVTTLGAADGISGIEERLRPLPALIEAANGRLWMSTSSEIYSVDPNNVYRNPLPPSTLIQSLTANGRTYGPGGSITLPMHTRSMRVDFVGLSLTLPEKVRYRYILDGVDTDWQDGESRHQAFYSNLEPGRYRFHVNAVNGDGVWSDPGASLEINIPPAYYQTRTFIWMWWILAFAALPIAMALRNRVREARSAAKMRERMKERERIARELHDTLIQDVEALALNLRALRHTLPPDGMTHQELSRLGNSAQRAIEWARNRVGNLRTHTRDSRYLLEVLEELCQNLTALYFIAYELEVVGTPLRLEPFAAEDMVAIAREAVINAFRHSRARKITVTVAFGLRLFELTVSDDGVGIGNPPAGQQGHSHWGVVGMNERARALASNLFIERNPEGGTVVRFAVAARVAYIDGQLGLSGWSWIVTRVRSILAG